MARQLQINATKPRVQYKADGIRTEFLFPFPVFTEANLEIYLGDVRQTEGFIALGIGETDGGQIIFATPPENGVTVTIRRRLLVSRTSEFQESGPFRAKAINDELNYFTAAIQQIEAETDRCVRLSQADTDSALVLPPIVDRAGCALIFDDNGDIAVKAIGALAGGVSSSWQSLDDVPEGQNCRRFTAAEKTKLAAVEAGAQANPRGVTASEKAAASETAARSFSPRDVADMVAMYAPGDLVASVHGRTGTVVGQAGDYNAEQITETANKVVMTAAERTKLGGVEKGAQVNTVATVHGRTGTVVGQAGDYNAEQITETTDKVVMTAAERNKLTNVAAGAQVNPTRISAAEKTAGTATTIRSYAPVDVRDMVATFAPGSAVASVAGKTGAVTLLKDDVGLGNLSNDLQIKADLGYAAKVSPVAGDKLLLKDQADGQPKLIDWSQLPVSLPPVVSVHGRIGAVIAQTGDYTAEQIAETANKVVMTTAERSKLTGIAAGAQVNTVATVHGRTGTVVAQTGDYTAEQITETADKVVMTAAERNKLTNVAAGAQVNPTRVSAAEKTAGTATTIRAYAPVDVRDMVATFAPASVVASVAGKTGAVTLLKDDVGLGNLSNDLQIKADLGYAAKASPVAGDKLLLKDQADGQPKLIDWSQLPVSLPPVVSVHGRIGAVIAQTGDYTAEQIADGTNKVVMTTAERSKLGGVEKGAQVNTVATVHGRTGTVVGQAGDYNAEQIADGTSKVVMTTAERSKLAGIAAGAQVNTVTMVHGRSGAVVAQAGDYTAEQITDGSTKVVMTTAERSKLTGIAAGAQMNTVTTVHGRSGAVVGQPGDYTAEQIADGTTKVVMTTAERSKLTGIAAGAQVNTITTVHGRSGAVVGQAGDYTAEQIADGATKVVMTAAERSKLTGIAAGAQVNPSAVSATEKAAPAQTTALRLFSPKDIADMISALAASSNIDGGTASSVYAVTAP